MNIGFFGLQFSFGLQQSNMAPIYSYLGASAAALPLLSLAGPATGLIVQQNPTQLLEQKERAMDWWLYWLNERDLNDAKREQYSRWDRLRALRNDGARRSRPPRSRWTAEPMARCEIDLPPSAIPVITDKARG